MRGLTTCGAVGLIAMLLATPAGARRAAVACPLRPGAPSGGAVQWAFSDSLPPPGGGLRSSYVHGRGTWTGGRATGLACTSDALRSGGAVRDLVLAVGGTSRLAGHVTEGGLPGVRLVVPVRVRASSDRACRVGATGTLTMFASYYAVHRDAARIAFGSGCTGHDRGYDGSALHVYIARHGAQVNVARASRAVEPRPRDREVVSVGVAGG